MKDLETFLTKVPSHSFYTTPFYKAYQSALEMFWFQRRKDALAFVTKTIEENIDHEDVQIFYRLWIETLSETHDRLALQMLKNHLARMAPSFENYDEWAALRGLVHFELEELEACAVILRGIGENVNSPYAMELRQRYEFRFAEDGKATLAILNCEASVTDFFILQTLARGLLANSQVEELSQLLDTVALNFPKSSLRNHFLFWKNFEENKLSEAESVGHLLENQFPDNEQFRFDLAYVLFCNGKTKEAIATLEQLSVKQRSHDPDALSLLGYGHLLESKDDTHSPHWEKAKSYFQLAKTQADHLGIPSVETFINQFYMNAKTLRTTVLPQNSWTLPITARRESELMTSVEQDIDFVFHELKKDVQENDLVYFTAEPTRVLSVYKVIKNPVWHPYLKNQGLLELVHRFEHSVSMPSLKQNAERFEMIKLSSDSSDEWFSQLDLQGNLREKLKMPTQKQRPLYLRKHA